MLPLRAPAPFVSLTTALVRAAIPLVVASVLSHPDSALAAASYAVTLQGSSQSSASPLRQSYHAATPGVAPTVISEEAVAAPGNVGAYARLDTTWPFDFQAGVSGSSGGRAATDDFTITGPSSATTVQGAIRFRTQVRLARGGGLAGSDAHRASATLHVTAAQLVADGSCWLGNLSEGSDGVLAGQSPPLLEVSFSLPGTFPVGQPFAVSMDFEVEDQTYGDSTVSPGFTETDGLAMGIELGDEHDQVMELPAGYTVNAPSWNVLANVASVVGLPAGTEPVLMPVAPNPSSGNMVLAFSLPRGGEVHLAVTDLQGRLVRRLMAGSMSAGPHDWVWDGRGDSGDRVVPGVYFEVVRFEDRTLTRRLVRVR